jgi:hypothetical protein
MPATQKYPSPPEQLRRLAEEARAEGKPFDEFWAAAIPPLVGVPIKVKGEIVAWKEEDDGSPLQRPATKLPRVDDEEIPPGAIRWPSDTFDRNCWYRAILDMEDHWRRLYEGLDAPVDHAVSFLAAG